LSSAVHAAYPAGLLDQPFYGWVNRKLLDWPTGYGVVSFGTKDLEWVVNYIRNQKEHHKKGTTVKRLENITHDEEDES